MSIVKIAEQAEVSISTVSRFFNKPASVSPRKADKIRKAAELINYQPKIVRPGPKAAARIGIHTGAIAFLSLYEFKEEMLRKPAMPILIGSIQRELLNKQLSLFWGQIDGSGKLPECVSSRYCDGIIFFGKSENPDMFARLEQKIADVPAVWCFREHMDADNRYDHIFYDNSTVGELAANHLAANGHRKIAVFNTTPSHTAYFTRVETFCRKAQEAGMEVTVFASSKSPENVPIGKIFRELAADFIRKGAGITGAFFCVDQDMLGIYIELLAAGYDARSLDMVGCNADEVALQYISPRPATIDIKIPQVGKMAVDRLLRRINGDCGSSTSKIFIAPELIKGERRTTTLQQ